MRGNNKNVFIKNVTILYCCFIVTAGSMRLRRHLSVELRVQIPLYYLEKKKNCLVLDTGQSHAWWISHTDIYQSTNSTGKRLASLFEKHVFALKFHMLKKSTFYGMTSLSSQYLFLPVILVWYMCFLKTGPKLGNQTRVAFIKKNNHLLGLCTIFVIFV